MRMERLKGEEEKERVTWGQRNGKDGRGMDNTLSAQSLLMTHIVDHFC